ncbi:uncharacterized protein [Spinacia oleracea]|uniref:Uncharacterized protein isoform X2 n=1 Tax=Spinacia oleracea TaxID=3562 RepID=A0ABM3RRT1_SPIOL|nr:uncharacterized protein LOC130471970 isoform X2 [Spinacia oleracea]
MDKLQEAGKKQICITENRLKLVEREKDEPLKMLNESMKLILDKSQQEVHGLKSQLEFLQLVNQNNMSIDELDEAFEKQLSVAENHWESLKDKKVYIEGALENIIKLYDRVSKNMKGEIEALSSYSQFVITGDQIVTKELLARAALIDNKIQLQKIVDLNVSLSEVQKDKEVLVTMKEKLEEDLKEKNRLEAILLDSMRKLEVGNVPSEVDVQNKVKIDPIDDQDMVHDTKTKGSDDDCLQGPVQSVVTIIQIDDDSSTETSASCYTGSEAEVSSGVSITQYDVMGKGTRKQPRQLRTRCNQKQLSNFLSNLTAEKRRVLENSIFKPFLSIPPRSICLTLLITFVERYDVKMDAFTIGKHAMRFCGKEVEECLGLPYKGKLVDFTTRVKRTPEVFDRCFGVKGKMTKDDLLDKLKCMHVNKGNADDFFRLSVYLMFSLYFFSTNDAYVSYWPVRYLENLELFKSFNWARAIYEYLRESVRKTSNELSEEVTTFISVKGCLPLLETLIYERIGSHYLKVDIDHSKISHPYIIKYIKGYSRNPCTIRRVLAKVKFEKIKECEDCSKEEGTSLESADTSGSTSFLSLR